MTQALFVVDASLAMFLRPEDRGGPVWRECARAATLKNAIEALGVPHTEIGEVKVGGAPATLQRVVREGDRIEVFPWHAQHPGDAPLFLADAHLGGLARFLRMLGFDTAHRGDYRDADIRRAAREQRRVVLSRDRELLKCSDVLAGAYVRALRPEAQLREVAERFGLAGRARPFTLCLACNLPLERVDAAEVASTVPPAVLERHSMFTRCRACGRVFWPGTHYERMREALGRVLA
ncbi:MAG: Mut7-C RNAse domain-containing protein [Clostridia bacterium]